MRLITFLKRIVSDRTGATAIEYGLIVSLIVIAIIGALNTFATETIAMWSSVETEMQNANGSV